MGFGLIPYPIKLPDQPHETLFCFYTRNRALDTPVVIFQISPSETFSAATTSSLRFFSSLIKHSSEFVVSFSTLWCFSFTFWNSESRDRVLQRAFQCRPWCPPWELAVGRPFLLQTRSRWTETPSAATFAKESLEVFMNQPVVLNALAGLRFSILKTYSYRFKRKYAF